MLMIKTSLCLRAEDLAKMHAEFVRQAEQGIIILPGGFELVDEIPLDDPSLIVVTQEETT